MPAEKTHARVSQQRLKLLLDLAVAYADVNEGGIYALQEKEDLKKKIARAAIWYTTALLAHVSADD